MAKKNSPESTGGESQTGTITKTEAVRRALAEGVVNPSEAVAYIRERFGLEMTNQQFSTAKFQETKKKGSKPRAGRQPREGSSWLTAVPGAKAGGNGKASPAELARQVKALVAQYGAEAVREMAAVFAE